SELGLASEICTPHRGLAGAFKLGTVPRPDAMLWSNMVCDNTAKSGELIMEMTGCPGFFIDRPFKDSDREIGYLVGELQDMVDFLEEKSGRRMDWDRLSEIVSRMDRQIQLTREINELRKVVPTPFSPQGFLELVSVDYLFPGQPEAIEYLETLRQELSDMVEEGKGAVENEQFRLMSLFIPPMYLMGFLGRISQEFGAVSVIEPFFTFWGEGNLDPSKPLESVARKSYMIPEMRMYGPMDERALDSIVDCAEQYKVDGAIYYADVGCRHTCATIKLFKDALSELNIPVLTLDCDVVDQTATSEEEVRGKLEGFFELLKSGKDSSTPWSVGRSSGSMKALGIDIGGLTTKAAILDGDTVLSSVITASGDDADPTARGVAEEALRKAGLGFDDVYIISTGVGGKDISFSHEQKALTTCLARGISYLFPSARMVIDMGAESSTVVKVNERGGVSEWANHDKCAAGTGIFLQQMAKLMQVPIEQMAEMSLNAKEPASITGTCAVFAESEVISHVHRDPPTPLEDVVAGIYASVVGRTMALCKRVGIEKDVALSGGVALNRGLLTTLEKEMGFRILVPEEPQLVGALGAAVVAREKIEGGVAVR
ncbi:MAG: acyl-CoA dehydratase activase, partial [Chloroflexota bacterium]